MQWWLNIEWKYRNIKLLYPETKILFKRQEEDGIDDNPPGKSLQDERRHAHLVLSQKTSKKFSQKTKGKNKKSGKKKKLQK